MSERLCRDNDFHNQHVKGHIELQSQIGITITVCLQLVYVMNQAL